MAGQTKIEELIAQKPKQDCGCGCEGSRCGTSLQEAVWADSPKPAAVKEPKSLEQCDCGCGCSG